MKLYISRPRQSHTHSELSGLRGHHSKEQRCSGREGKRSRQAERDGRTRIVRATSASSSTWVRTLFTSTRSLHGLHPLTSWLGMFPGISVEISTIRFASPATSTPAMLGASHLSCQRQRKAINGRRPFDEPRREKSDPFRAH